MRVLSRRNFRRPLALAFGFTLAACPAAAQDEAAQAPEIGRWYPTLEAGMLLTQSSFSDNWAGGDQGQLSWTFILNGELKNQLTEKWNSQNTLTLAYGQTSTQSGQDRQWSAPNKSTDRIDFESILRATLGFHLDPYASLRVESQFQDASDPLGRDLTFNPILVKEAVGVAHEFYDEETRQFLVRFGGALRQSIRSQFVDEVDPDNTETTRESGLDGGLEFVVDYKNQFFEDAIAWTSKASFYQPLFYSAKSDLEDLDAAAFAAAGVDPDVADYTTTVDIDWENIFTGQITKYVSMNLYVRFLYDKYDTSVEPLIADGVLENGTAVQQGIRKAGQFKQTLALGLTYRFF